MNLFKLTQYLVPFTRITLVILLLCAFVPKRNLYGQEVDTSRKITINDVNVVKDFEAKLMDAKPILIKPPFPESSVRPLFYPYEITIIPLELEYPAPVIKPYAMSPDPEIEQYHFYLEGGYGTLNNPNVKFSYGRVQEDRYTFNTFLQYDALDNSKKIDLQKFQDLKVMINGSYRIGENHEIAASLDTDIKERFLYSTEVRLPQVDDEVLDRAFSRTTVQATYKNIEEQNGLRYFLTPSINVLDINRSGIQNTSFDIASHISKSVSLEHLFSLGLTAAYSRVNTENAPSEYLVEIAPNYHFSGDNWWISLGGDLMFSASEASIWPQSELGINIVHEKVQAFAGSKQEGKINDLNANINDVPYLFSDVDTLISTLQQSIYAGARGNLGRLQYEGKLSYNRIQNYQFFNPNDIRFFEIEQFFDNCETIEFDASTSVYLNSWFKLGGRITQRFFNLDTFEKAWGIPVFEWTTYGEAALMDDRLHIRTDFLFANGVDYTLRGSSGSLNELFDLSLEARLTINDHMGIYMNGYNLLNNAYRRHFGYPTVGIHGRVGAWVKF
jgi:hypothetical protein